ncbi:MAG: hypothetical protein V7713_03675 [Marinobacter sp.]|uniref:hypothetical protein n=1 Tax=Marinobacter sp. AC-23 TaxID=1879031 RepID=UPI0008DC7012|nr:hypothetical protein [Marinobacter sp. AC-23]OHY80607.1 hypothetical protein BCA33_14050 [Marinobacter sp. AC-23]
MPRMTLPSLFVLSTLPGFVLAGQPTADDYLASKSLLLEVRYCECQATRPDSPPSDLLSDFLESSNMLQASISGKDKGFLSSQEFSMGYELRPAEGSPGTFNFNYAGEYLASSGDSSGYGNLVLKAGQWTSLFGSHHENETDSQHTDVAVRLVKMGGS